MIKKILLFAAAALFSLAASAAVCRIEVTTVNCKGDGMRLLPTSTPNVYAADAETGQDFTAMIFPDPLFKHCTASNTVPAGVTVLDTGLVRIPKEVLAANAGEGLSLTVETARISYTIRYYALGDGQPLQVQTPEEGRGVLTPAEDIDRCWIHKINVIRDRVRIATGGDPDNGGLHAEGWRFLGWSRTQGATTAEIAPGADVPHLTLMDGNVVNLYAVWQTTVSEGQIAYPSALQNGGFEFPVVTESKGWSVFPAATYDEEAGVIVDEESVGWCTTASDQLIEFGNVTLDIGRLYGTTMARDGVQFAELNANKVGLLYQRLAALPNSTLKWGFSHRARGGSVAVAGEDTMAMWIGTSAQITEARSIYERYANRSDNDALKLSRDEAMEMIAMLSSEPGNSFTNIIHTAVTNSSTKVWDDISGEYTVPPGCPTVDFAFVSWSQGTGDKASTYGNLIDHVYMSDHAPLERHHLIVRMPPGGKAVLNDSSTNLTVLAENSVYDQYLDNGTRVFISVAEAANCTLAGAIKNDTEFLTVDEMVALLEPLTTGGITEDLTIEFVFTSAATVFFRPNGGVYRPEGVDVSSVTLSGDRPLYEPKQATRENYVFIGWLERNSGIRLPLTGSVITYEINSEGEPEIVVSSGEGDQTQTLLSVPAENGLTLYAQWAIDEEAAANRQTYPVFLFTTHATGDGTIMKPLTATAWEGRGFENEEFITTVFPDPGYRLPGAITVENDRGEPLSGWTYNPVTGVITIPAELMNQQINITVACDQMRYKILYISGGQGHPTGDVQVVDGTWGTWQQDVVCTNDTVTLASQGTLESAGWTFIGWAYDAGSTNADFVAGSTVPHLTRQDMGVVRLYGIWQASDSGLSSYPIALMNGYFEQPPNIQPGVPGYSAKFYNQYAEGVPGLYWYTTASDHKIEIASVQGSFQSSAMSAGAYHTAFSREGVQFAELNCNKVGALYQDIATVPGTTLYYGFSHKAREPGDALALLIGSTNDFQMALDIYKKYAPADKTVTTTEPWYDLALEEICALTNSTSLKVFYHEATYDATDYYGWEDLNGEYTVPEGQNVTKFAFLSLSRIGAGKDASKGNLIDNVYFTTSEPLQPATLIVRTTDGGRAVVNDAGPDLFTASLTNTYFNVLVKGRHVVISPVAEPEWSFLGCYVGTTYYPKSDCDSQIDFLMPANDRRMTLLFARSRTITFNAEGGSYEYQSLRLSTSLPSYTLSAPTREGYVFKGWQELTTGKIFQPGDIANYQIDAQFDENVSSWLVCGEGDNEAKVQSADGMVLNALWEIDPASVPKVMVQFVDLKDYTKPAPQPFTELAKQTLSYNGLMDLTSNSSPLKSLVQNTQANRPKGFEPTGWLYEPVDGGDPVEFDFVHKVTNKAGPDGGYIEVMAVTNGVYDVFRFDDVQWMRFIARWDRFYDVTRMEPDGTTTNRAAWVPKSWLDKKGYTSINEDNYRTEIESLGENGIPLWKSYIFGLDPTNKVSVGINYPYQHAVNRMATLSLEGVKVVKYINDIYGAVSPDGKTYMAALRDYRTYTVKFVLLGTDDRRNGPWEEIEGVEHQDTPSFDVDMTRLTKRYYRIEGRVLKKAP